MEAVPENLMATHVDVYNFATGERVAEVVIFKGDSMSWRAPLSWPTGWPEPEEYHRYAQCIVSEQLAICARPHFLEPT